jgi:glutathione peroxidase
MTTAYDFSAKTLDGQPKPLSDYSGDVLLIVNVASKCGFTPQYEGLEALHRKYADKGLRVLGFPCNQFGGQEPGDAAEIANFCATTYAVDFPMFAKIEVNGANADPLYGFLKTEKPGLLGTEGIKWNFTKFLVNRKGEVAGRFAPNVKPEDLEGEIEKLLAA